ncbi:MAG: sugar-binding protein [Candidatus Sericytochromatia bacterium]|nr:sugar-binding protein [Candidatus Sericytochromatia bacterium]
MAHPPDQRTETKRFRTFAWTIALLLALFAMAALLWWRAPGQTRETQALAPPRLESFQREGLMALLAPGYPSLLPLIETRAGSVRATEGSLDAVAAILDLQTGRALWGVAYHWSGPVTSGGGRVTQPGFAVVVPPQRNEPGSLLYLAAGTGGWERSGSSAYEGTLEVLQRVDAVAWSDAEAGFLVHQQLESALGGRMGRGVTRAFGRSRAGWELFWEEETHSRLRPDRTFEMTQDTGVEVIDPDGDGLREIATTPTWYVRQLASGDRGIHFLAEAPGRYLHRRLGSQFQLASLQLHGGSAAALRLRGAPPLLAVRTPQAPRIDGQFDDWDRVEVNQVGLIWLEDLSLLRYQRRPRRGTHDFSGACRLMWDVDALYLRADVLDDRFRQAQAGKRLYEGDHVALWIDRDLDGDFAQGTRNRDDWQVGLAPRLLEGFPVAAGEAWVWVPRAGRQGITVATAPLMDPFDGARRGYQMEARIPWSAVGGVLPDLRAVPPLPTTDPRQELAARRYRLQLVARMGLTVVLTDADERPQELAYVTNPEFGWGDPRTFNTLMLVDWVRLP